MNKKIFSIIKTSCVIALIVTVAACNKPEDKSTATKVEGTTSVDNKNAIVYVNSDSMQSFDLMADTARAIAETLGGELKDEQRSVMTRQTLEHCKQRIRDFERTRLFRRPPRN